MGFPRPGIESRKAAAIDRLGACESLVVALSGGVDSAVLLSLAATALGADRVLAVTAVSESVPGEEVDDARRVAEAVGVAHEVVRTLELQRPAYRANSGDRCFHCRTELFETLGALARERGYRHVAYGAIKDDVGDFRPGMRAAEEHGAVAPLLDADLDKQDVRALAGEAGLAVHDKPAAACLSSRIPVGTEVTPERLAQIGRAEAALRALDFRQLRVRHHGDVARLELDAEGQRRLAADPRLRARVVEAVKSAGFRHVAMDLEGYRSGSLNPARLVTIGELGPENGKKPE